MTSDAEFGPKMLALNDRQRRFVMFLVEFPGATQREAAIQAGYSDASGRAVVTACELMQDKRIIEAIQEQAGKRMWAISLKASAKVDQLIDSDDPAVALKASLSVLDRVGIAPVQTINVNQTVRDESSKAILERIGELAHRLGVPVQGLLKKPEPIEAEFTEVKDGGQV